MSALARALGAETLKVTSLKSWWLLGIVLAVYIALTAASLAFFLSEAGAALGGGAQVDPVTTAELVYSSTTAVGLVIPLLFGALLATTEYRHHTLTPTYLALPHRGVVLTAKAIVALIVGALYGVIGAASAVAAGAPVLVLTGGETALGESSIHWLLARTLLATALWALLGLGLGALLTSQIAAIVIVLVFTQFVEPVLRLVAGIWEWSAQLGRFLPGSATDALVGAGILSSIGAIDPTAPSSPVDPLTWWQGGLVLTALCVVLLVAASLTTQRRDVE